MATSVLRDIFRVNLGVKKTERCLIFTDVPSPSETLSPAEYERRSRLKCVAFLASEIGKSFSREVVVREFSATGRHGAEPPRELWEAAFGSRAIDAMNRKKVLGPLLAKTATEQEIREAEKTLDRFKRDAFDVVIALSNYSTSHTRFRDLLTRICGTRYASMPLFEFSMLEGPMDVDWKNLAKISRGIASRVNKAEEVAISTPNGSKLSFSTRGRKALSDAGILTKRGAFGNLPAGEVFLAPVEGSAKGRLVLEWAPTRELSSAVTLVIRDGLVKEVTGEETFAGELRKRLSEREENRNIAEFGIGTNSRAKRPDNILESEKIMGTIHIALGDNSSFGGKVKTPLHQDFVFFRPTVRLVRRDGSVDILMKKGKLQVR
ncbi:MAG: aminopeptidase [Acidobacteriota bacterium]